jgi:hypothetical protein
MQTRCCGVAVAPAKFLSACTVKSPAAIIITILSMEVEALQNGLGARRLPEVGNVPHCTDMSRHCPCKRNGKEHRHRRRYMGHAVVLVEEREERNKQHFCNGVRSTVKQAAKS